MTPAHPLTVDEHNTLGGEGTVAAALAARSWAFVECEHGSFRGDEWHEHTHDADVQTHDILWIERSPDYVEDCVLILESGSDREGEPG